MLVYTHTANCASENKANIYVWHVSAGAQCCIELHTFTEAVQWCDEGLKAHPTDKKLLELRAAADKHRVQSLRNAFDFFGGNCRVIIQICCVTICKAVFFVCFVFCSLEGSRERLPEGQGQREKAA